MLKEKNVRIIFQKRGEGKKLKNACLYDMPYVLEKRVLARVDDATSQNISAVEPSFAVGYRIADSLPRSQPRR